MNPDEKLFDGYIFVYWSIHKVPLLPSVRLVALAENNPQRNQWTFIHLFPPLILSVVPSPVQRMCTGDGATDKIRRGKRRRKLHWICWRLFQLTPPDEQKVVRELHEEFNKKTYNCQTTSHQDSFCMSISEHSNDLASTIDLKCNRKKQDKCLSNHHFPLHLPEKTKIILVRPSTIQSNGTLLTFSGSSGCNWLEVGGENQRSSWGCWIYLGRDSREKPSQKLKHMQVWPNGYWEIWRLKMLFRRK